MNSSGKQIDIPKKLKTTSPSKFAFWRENNNIDSELPTI